MKNNLLLLFCIVGVDLFVTIIFAALLLIGAFQNNAAFVERGATGIAVSNVTTAFIVLFYGLFWLDD